MVRHTYEPENIFIGAEGGHPHWSLIGDALRIPAMGDTFRVLEPGKYRVPWDGRKDQGARAGSGIYFLRLTIEGSSVIRKVSVVR